MGGAENINHVVAACVTGAMNTPFLEKLLEVDVEVHTYVSFVKFIY